MADNDLASASAKLAELKLLKTKLDENLADKKLLTLLPDEDSPPRPAPMPDSIISYENEMGVSNKNIRYIMDSADVRKYVRLKNEKLLDAPTETYKTLDAEDLYLSEDASYTPTLQKAFEKHIAAQEAEIAKNKNAATGAIEVIQTIANKIEVSDDVKKALWQDLDQGEERVEKKRECVNGRWVATEQHYIATSTQDAGGVLKSLKDHKVDVLELKPQIG